MKRRILAAGLTLPLALNACSDIPYTEIAGTAAGAVVGGVVGWQLGAGAGRIAAISVGAVMGGAVGYLGTTMLLNPSDEKKAKETTGRALDQAPDGAVMGWMDAKTGNSGTVTPVRTYRSFAGALCRDFRVTLEIGEDFALGEGTACQEADGSWKSRA
jgi:surface antigen